MTTICDNKPFVAVCGQWFTANGIAKIMGSLKDDKNKEVADKSRAVFWLD